MRHRLHTRITAWALSALFLGGVGGASDLDAFLFHGSAAGVVANLPHVETAGNPNCHAEHCVLALRLANGRTPRALSLPVRFESIPLLVATARPALAPHRFDPALHLPSRAPPVSLV